MTTSFRLIALSIAALGLASCQSSQNSSDPYASNAAAGGYNPYPDSTGGYVSNSGSAPSYQTPPASTSEPAPQYDPYAYTAPKTTPKTTASHSSSAPKSSAKKKTTASTTSKKKSSTSSKRHTVKQGETLYGIARSNHTTVAKLKAANGISSDLIRPGQTLKIP